MPSKFTASPTFVSRFALAVIAFYQRFLSPYKKYRCAHRARHGGASCSQFAREAITAEGLARGLMRLRGRFRECHAASRALRQAPENPIDQTASRACDCAVAESTECCCLGCATTILGGFGN